MSLELTEQQYKMYFHFILKKKIFNIDEDFFTNEIIMRVYKSIKLFYLENEKIPNLETIFTMVNELGKNEITPNHIKSLMNLSNGDYLDTMEFVKQFTKNYKFYLSSKELSKMIEYHREKNDNLFNLLNINDDFLSIEKRDIFKIYNPDNEIPDIDWIAKPLISKNDLGILFGPAGHGKSYFTLDLAINISNGYDDCYNGYINIPKKRNILYIDFENGEQTIHQRLKNYSFNDKNFKLEIIDMAEFSNLAKEKYIKEKLKNKEYEKNDAVLDIVSNNLIESVKKDFENEIIDIIFIDNLSNIALSMEKTDEANNFIDKFNNRFKNKSTLFFLGHTPKIRNINGELFTIELLKGSSELANNFTNIIGWKNFDKSQNLSYLVQLKKRTRDGIDDRTFISEKLPIFSFINNKFNLEYIDNEYDIINTFKKKIDDKRGNSMIKKSMILYDYIYNKVETNLLLPKYEISRPTLVRYNKEYKENLSLQKYIKVNEKLIKSEIEKINNDNGVKEIKNDNFINKVKNNFDKQSGKSIDELFK